METQRRRVARTKNKIVETMETMETMSQRPKTETVEAKETKETEKNQQQGNTTALQHCLSLLCSCHSLKD